MLVSQLCLTLCDPLDCSPPGSSVHEILQAGILEWVAISYFRVYDYSCYDCFRASVFHCRLYNLWLQRIYSMGTGGPTLQIKKLRPRAVKSAPEGTQLNRWQSQELNPGLCSSRSFASPSMVCAVDASHSWVLLSLEGQNFVDSPACPLASHIPKQPFVSTQRTYCLLKELGTYLSSSGTRDLIPG